MTWTRLSARTGPVHVLYDQDHRLLLGQGLQQREQQLTGFSQDGPDVSVCVSVSLVIV